MLAEQNEVSDKEEWVNGDPDEDEVEGDVADAEAGRGTEFISAKECAFGGSEEEDDDDDGSSEGSTDEVEEDGRKEFASRLANERVPSGERPHKVFSKGASSKTSTVEKRSGPLSQEEIRERVKNQMKKGSKQKSKEKNKEKQKTKVKEEIAKSNVWG